jgi:tRNA (mo5U34)-methyltransferase
VQFSGGVTRSGGWLQVEPQAKRIDSARQPPRPAQSNGPATSGGTPDDGDHAIGGRRVATPRPDAVEPAWAIPGIEAPRPPEPVFRHRSSRQAVALPSGAFELSRLERYLVAVTPSSELIREIRERKWFHTIDLGDGLITGGNPPSEVLATPGALPDVQGRSVLDIGAWDGKYSFEAERAGAARVVALDHFIWLLNPPKLFAYYDQCESAGTLPHPDQIDARFLDAVWLPGKRGFDMAKEYLSSKVEAVVSDFMSMDLEQLGTFDIIYYFGVLYHMHNPLGSLERLRRVTGELAVIETLAVDIPACPDGCLLEFYPGNEQANDYTNWFAPTELALHGMCKAAGFRRVETRAKDLAAKHPPNPVPSHRVRRRNRAAVLDPDSSKPSPYRIVVHAFP